MTPAVEALRRALDGLVIRPDEEVDALEREQRATEAAQVVLAGLPRALRRRQTGRELEARVGAELARAVRAWDARRSLVLLGPTGAGKSTAAAWALRAFVARGVTAGGEAWRRARGACWAPASDLARARAEHRLGAGDAPLVARAAAASVLVVDDIGQEGDPAAIRDVLAARYDAGLPTLATSNLRQPALDAHLGAAGLRKLVEARGGRAVLVDLWGGR